MPIMPRMDKRAAKIAYRILGKPANMQKSSYKKQSSLPTDKRYYDEFERIRPDAIAKGR